jgi:hypothetical protein
VAVATDAEALKVRHMFGSRFQNVVGIVLAIMYFALSALGRFLANYPARWAGLFYFAPLALWRDPLPSSESTI